jgi:hypothetical protein
MQLIVGNVSIFKSENLPVQGSFTGFGMLPFILQTPSNTIGSFLPEEV